MGSRAQLQGIPWHEERMKKTCNDGSKYCIYNHKICSNTACKFHHKQCVGKGNCDWFEPKTGTPKVYAEKTYKMKKSNEEKNQMGNQQKNNQNNHNVQPSKNKAPLNEKHQKFIDNAEKRVNDIILKIETLENLSNKNTYEYSNEEIEKMFDSIEETLRNVKQSFINKNRTRFKF